MRFIAEYNENDIECFTEAKKNGEKGYYIEGIFAQAEKKNRNGRLYPKRIMESAVDKYVTEQVNQDRAVGELNHPDGPTINYKEVSHKITELYWKGDDVIGKASILNTPNGKIVKGLMDGNVRLGVSTRGMGSLETLNGSMVVGSDFILNTVDIVQDPSAHEAFVNGITEGVEWSWKNGKLVPQLIEKEEEETEIISASLGVGLYESEVREFKNFLSILKSNF